MAIGFWPHFQRKLWIYKHFSQVDHQVVKAMLEHTNENSMIKLWHQLVTNSMLIVCLFELMRLVNLAIV
jgi:hypothetical protein